MNSILFIAKKEFMDNFRNYWILSLSIILAALSLIASYFSSTGFGFQDFETTIRIISVPVQFFIPIISLMLGYGTIVGEIERGSMSSLLTHPVTRFDVIIGKFIGLGSVIATIVVFGFGISGIIIAINIPNPNIGEYLLFIFTSILLGLVFMSLALLFSTLFKKRSSSMAGAILLWFFFIIIWQFIMIGILFAALQNFESSTPDWYYNIQLFNPAISSSFIGSGLIEDYIIIFSLITWCVIPILLSYIIFRKKDV